MRIGFDLDGTIITCKEKHCILMQAVTRAFGVQLYKEKYWEAKRSGFNNIQSLVSQGISKDTAVKINYTWISSIEKMEWSNFDTVISSTLKSMSLMRLKGHSLHLISARNNRQNALIQLQALDIIRYFDTINFVGEKSGLKKSDYFKTLNLDCYIGDTEADYFESKKSNIKFHPILTGMRNKAFFRQLGIKGAMDNTIDEFLERISNE